MIMPARSGKLKCQISDFTNGGPQTHHLYKRSVDTRTPAQLNCLPSIKWIRISFLAHPTLAWVNVWHADPGLCPPGGGLTGAIALRSIVPWWLPAKTGTVGQWRRLGKPQASPNALLRCIAPFHATSFAAAWYAGAYYLPTWKSEGPVSLRDVGDAFCAFNFLCLPLLRYTAARIAAMKSDV